MNIKKRAINFRNIFLRICAKLLNQGFHETEILLINIWSIMAVVLVSYFSSNIRSALIYQPMKTINNFDELIESNLSLMTGSYGYIKHAIQLHPNDSIKLYKMKGRINYFNVMDDQNQLVVVTNITNNKIAYVGEGIIANNLYYKYPKYATQMAFAKERYFASLIGYLVNRKKTVGRLKIHKMYVIKYNMISKI